MRAIKEQKQYNGSRWLLTSRRREFVLAGSPRVTVVTLEGWPDRAANRLLLIEFRVLQVNLRRANMVLVCLQFADMHMCA